MVDGRLRLFEDTEKSREVEAGTNGIDPMSSHPTHEGSNHTLVSVDALAGDGRLVNYYMTACLC